MELGQKCEDEKHERWQQIEVTHMYEVKGE